jgi:uncharacterized protein YegJ (DUF2314 family)
MLKFELDKIDDLDDSLKPMYEQAGDKYRLKVEGIPQPDNSLADRLAKLEANNKALLDEKLAAKAAADQAKLEAAKKGGDVEALEKSWAQKLSDREAELAGEVNNYKSLVTSLTVGATAATVAAEVFGDNADLMMHHVNSRMTTEIVDGRAKVRVLDREGKPTAMSVEDLKSEFKNNPRFAAFVVGSRASGSVPPGGKGSGGGSVMTRSAFDQLGPAQKAKFMQEGGRLTE